MPIKTFPFGVALTSSFAISASYVQSASYVAPTASLAEFVTGFTGPTGKNAITTYREGFVYLDSLSILFVSGASNTSGSVVFPPHQKDDLIILYGETNIGAGTPVVSASSLNNNWKLTSVPSVNPIPLAGKPTILMYKFASSSGETFPEFSSNPPTNTSVAIYRNVDQVESNLASVYSGNGSFLFSGVSSTNFTVNREHWVVYVTTAMRTGGTTNIESLYAVPRSGFTSRLTTYSGSNAVPSASVLAICDSNSNITAIGSTPTDSSPSVNSNFIGNWIVLRANMDYSVL